VIGLLIAFGYASRLSTLAQKLPNAENAIVSIFRPSTPENPPSDFRHNVNPLRKTNARPAPDVEFAMLRASACV
jgi:hypothetical protein